MHDLVSLKLNVMKRNLVALLSERPSYVIPFLILKTLWIFKIKAVFNELTSIFQN